MEQQSSPRAGAVEVHGIDLVPDAERHGRPRDLIAVWSASTVNYLSIVLGGLLVVLGLELWQALLVVVVGNLFWLAIGYMATSGPASGTPSSVISRSQFGVRGNRVFVGLLNWPTFIAYEAINLALGSLAAFALAGQLGLELGRGAQAVVVVVTAAVTLTISVYGHATILRLSGAFTAVLAAIMALLGVFVVSRTDWSYHPATGLALTGWAVPATMLAGVTLIASAPLSWGISPDYARYLPRDASPRAVAACTALGGFLPSVLLGGVGVLAGSVIDMTDPQTSLAAIVPGWFHPVFLAVVVLGSMTNNVLTMYSSGLCLQAVGIPLQRSVTVVFDGVVGVALALYALFVSDFTSALSGVLELTVALLGPVITIFCVDVWLRRNRYDGLQLHDESPRSPFWFHGGVNLAGAVALVVGTTLATLCVTTSVWEGPVAAALGGADLSTVVGPLASAILYVVLTRRLYPRHAVRWGHARVVGVAGRTGRPESTSEGADPVRTASVEPSRVLSA